MHSIDSVARRNRHSLTHVTPSCPHKLLNPKRVNQLHIASAAPDSCVEDREDGLAHRRPGLHGHFLWHRYAHCASHARLHRPPWLHSQAIDL